MRFESILVANRGEIACRVLRTAAALGYRTVVVYSDADAHAPQVHMANEAYRLGPAAASESYLNIERVLEAARASGCDAIHPGYGFLSENADFAHACAAAGITFIGPNVEAIRLMGNKAEAKRRMIAAGVPCVPGYQGRNQSDGALAAAADEIGFPLMVKAAAGGGGRGMRLVRDSGGLPAALSQARSEAANAFGSDELILERAIQNPRHVEIQVFADAHGTVLHLGERDCSVQRRHQKIIEEAPSPAMNATLRAAMGAAAVAAARSIGYRGAGTVEFLLDENGEFFFLEMNTRLQVEHPVTEMITGLDLVELQIRVAEGRPLGLAQDDVRLDGHAIEARLYAEDPDSDFLPSTGTIDLWQAPAGAGVRTDAGIESGGEVSPHYDPLVAKIIAWGPSRELARRRLVGALEDTALFGPRSNRDFLIDALGKPGFTAGAAGTAFIEEEYANGVALPPLSSAHAAAAATLQFLAGRDAARGAAVGVAPELLNWSSNTRLQTDYRYQGGSEALAPIVRPQAGDVFRVEVGGAVHEIRVIDRSGANAHLLIDGHPARAVFLVASKTRLYLSFQGRIGSYTNTIGVPTSAGPEAGGGRILAPMHGVLVEVFVKPGDRVVKGDRLLTLEAMKMQHEVPASSHGVVEAVHFAPGSQVAADSLLMEISRHADNGKAGE